MDASSEGGLKLMGKGRIRAAWAVCALLALGVPSPAAVVVPKDVQQLSVECDRIIIGDVTELRSDWSFDAVGIRTTLTIEISDTLKGPSSREVALILDGGSVGDVTAFTSDTPTFQLGDRVLLFLAGDPPRLYGAYQGAYLTDGVDAVQTEGGPAQADFATRLPLAELLDEIRFGLPAGEVPAEVSPYAGSFTLPGSERYVPAQCNWVYVPQPMGEPFKINPNCAGGGSCGSTSQQVTAIRTGPSAWDAVGTNFRFSYGGTTAVSQSAFDGVNSVYFDQSGSINPEVVSRTTYWCVQSIRMVEWDIAFNDLDYDFWNGVSASCPAGTYDLKSVATHEFGHALGLAHSPLSAATMFAGTFSCNTEPRSLEPDDLDGVRFIYGVCGNSHVEGPEQCDDGGVVPGDGCSPQCRFEAFTGNDNCANAILVGDGQYNFDTISATTDGPAEPAMCKFAGDNNVRSDIWLRYLSTCTGNASIRLCGSTFDTKLAIYEGDVCPASGSAIACNDDSTLCSPAQLISALSVPMIEGHSYLIRIGGYQGETGAGTLTIEGPVCPSNDDCGNQIPVEDGQTFFDTTGATTDGPAEPGECTFFNFPQVAQDIWYCYESSCTGWVTVDLCSSLYDAKVAVYDSCACPQEESAIACNDDYCDLQSRVVFAGTAGNNYLIRIGGWNTASGAGSMVITCAPVECWWDGDCEDGDPCSDDHCDGSICTHWPKDDGDCDDGDPCTERDSCFQGMCKGGQPLPCDDGLFCNGEETCADGVCLAGSDPCADEAWCDEGTRSCIVVGAPGDADRDGDVDLRDTCELQRCFGAYSAPKCQAFDVAGQGGAVDWDDYREFTLVLTGPVGG